MLALTIRTDSPVAEISIIRDEQILSSQSWRADRQLSDTLLTAIDQLFEKAGVTTKDAQGVIAFKGPGSFTGLRIGLTVANTFAYGLDIPIVSSLGDDWIAKGLSRLNDGQNEHVAMPHYGAEPNITSPKK